MFPERRGRLGYFRGTRAELEQVTASVQPGSTSEDGLAVARRRADGDAALNEPFTNWINSRVRWVDEAPRGIELACPNPSCTARPRLSVTTLIADARAVAAGGGDTIWL
jgi:hypothetical protein